MHASAALLASRGGARTARLFVHRWLPQGHPLPDEVWRLRHRWVVMLLAVQTAGLPVFAVIRGYSLTHGLFEAAVPAVMTVVATWSRPPRMVRAMVAGLGLMVISGIVVHLSGGSTEAHFHFFVMVPIVALYESWYPFGVAVGFVLVQHGVLGTIESDTVYNHRAAQEHPWTWAAIHAALFAAACVGALINWKLHESARAVATYLSHQAHHDPLTGLPNRTFLQNGTSQALALASEQDQQPTLLLLDLDGFKDVNDTHGHAQGDLVLVEMAQRLRASVRPEDIVSRLGGDEFAVLLTDCPSSWGERVAERITEAVTRPFVIDGVTLDMEVSIGIATAEPGINALTLVRHADAAMYAAKEQKLGATRYRAGQECTAATRLELLGALRHALDLDQIVLHYQPKVSILSGETIGFEALARWQHPTRGLLGPAEFIPVLEKTTRAPRFTRHVLASALAQARRWLDDGFDLPVAVNVSTRCLLDPDFPQTVTSELLAAGVEGRSLCIEITEHSVFSDPHVAITALARIRALGVRTAIDDFGTGYSSLVYLKMLPADELKIDRSFVRDVATDPSNAVLVEAAIRLGRSLGLVVVAEGVEDERAAAKLKELGGDLAQGYYFSRPLPAHELVISRSSSATGAGAVVGRNGSTAHSATQSSTTSVSS